MDWLTDPTLWIALLTLTVLEIVLGIDNIVFISILAGRLPREQQAKARRTGIAAALLTRLALLFSISWLARLTTPLFSVLQQDVSGRDLVLMAGGLFLIAKSVGEIHHKLEGPETASKLEAAASSFGRVVLQIMVIDVVFSLDSVITAVGMVSNLWIMVAANVVAMAVMLWLSGPISDFVDRHPSIKVLALAFLILIGVNLIAEGFHQHIPRGYTYFAMAFALAVEVVNIRANTRGTPVKLHEPVL